MGRGFREQREDNELKLIGCQLATACEVFTAEIATKVSSEAAAKTSTSHAAAHPATTSAMPVPEAAFAAAHAPVTTAPIFAASAFTLAPIVLVIAFRDGATPAEETAAIMMAMTVRVEKIHFTSEHDVLLFDISNDIVSYDIFSRGKYSRMIFSDSHPSTVGAPA